MGGFLTTCVRISALHYITYFNLWGIVFIKLKWYTKVY